jgi:hypothetical protein
MPGRPARHSDRHGKAQGGQIEWIDKLAQEPRGVIRWHPVFKGGREKELLAVIGREGVRQANQIRSATRAFEITFEF